MRQTISREDGVMLWNPDDFPLLPLTASELQPQTLPNRLMSTPAEQLFPDACDAKAALAGFLLMSGHWDLSHQISQDIPSREGSYWHAIAHRLEPDSWNSGYWFKRVGEHPIFTSLHAEASVILSAANSKWRLKDVWDPQLFITWCDEARPSVGAKRTLARQIQQAECNLLFSWCAVKRKDL
jgi:hypothetical protein